MRQACVRRSRLRRAGAFAGGEADDNDAPPSLALAETVLALLAAGPSGAPAVAHVLDGAQARGVVATVAAVVSLLVALGRKEAWATAQHAALWSRSRGVLLPSLAYVRVAQRRAEAGHWDPSLEALHWMRDHGVQPSGEAVEAVAQLVALGGDRVSDRPRLQLLLHWLQATEAGSALWPLFARDMRVPGSVPDDEEGDARPAWRSTGIALDDVPDLATTPIEELQERVKSLRSQAPTARKEGASADWVEGTSLAGGGVVADRTSRPPARPAAPAPAPAIVNDVDVDALLRGRV